MKFCKYIIVLTEISIILISCKDKNSPGIEYMPDMYRTPAIEAYSKTNFWADSMSTRKPVENTIPRGYMPFTYPNTNKGYELAGKELKNPIPFSQKVLDEGKVVYGKFCVQCHGKQGKGDGLVAKNSNWPGPPPAYDGRLKDLPEGKIFFSIHYGKNMMGSFASQISKKNRWKLVYYIQKLQGKNFLEKRANTADYVLK